MKKLIKNALILAAFGCVLFASCKKEYHCQCTFNNKVVYTTDLGSQYKKNATDQCNSYDSTVTGEAWNCTLY